MIGKKWLPALSALVMAVGVGPNHNYLNGEYIQKVVKSGLEIHPYTVNDKERMKQLIN